MTNKGANRDKDWRFEIQGSKPNAERLHALIVGITDMYNELAPRASRSELLECFGCFMELKDAVDLDLDFALGQPFPKLSQLL